MAGSQLWLVAVLICWWSVISLQEDLHKKSRGKTNTTTKLPFLTKEDNGLMVAGLIIGYLLRNGVYWIVSTLPSYHREFDSGEAPAWIRKEYRIFKDLQWHCKNYELQDVTFVSKTPFESKSFNDLNYVATKTKLNTTMASHLNKSVNALGEMFSSPPSGHTAFIKIKYAETLDQLLGTTHLSELLGVVETTEENLIGYADWVKDELFYNLADVTRLLRKRYSNGRPVGSKVDIVNAMDKLFATGWRVYNNPAVLGETLQNGVNMPNLTDVIFTTVNAVKGVLSYYSIGIEITKDSVNFPVTINVPELYLSPSAHLPESLKTKLLKKRTPRDTNLAKYSSKELYRVLGKYEMDKKFGVITYVIDVETHSTWVKVEKRMKLLTEAYRKTHANPAQAPNITLDIPTLKLLSQSLGKGNFGLPEDFALIIKNLGWKKPRGRRSAEGSTETSKFPEYRTLGSFWDVLTSYFGYKPEVVESQPDDLSSNAVSSFSGEDCNIYKDGAHCMPPVVSEPSRYQIQEHQLEANSVIKYVAVVTLDPSALQAIDPKVWEKDLALVAKVDKVLRSNDTWDTAIAEAGLPPDFLKTYVDYFTHTYANITMFKSEACETGAMCGGSCMKYKHLDTGKRVCCSGCKITPIFMPVKNESLCICIADEISQS